MADAAPDITSVFIREGDGTKGSVHFLVVENKHCYRSHLSS